MKRLQAALASILVLVLSGVVPALLEPSMTFASHTQCSDGIDNDQDGVYDYPEDDDCESLDDDFEGVGLSGLFVSITDGKDEVHVGNTIIYVISLKQQRDEIRNVQRVDLHLPHQANIVSASDGGRIINESVIRWDNVTVQRSHTQRMTVQVHVNPKTLTDKLMIARVLSEGTEATDTTLITDKYLNTTGQQQFRIRITDNKEYVTSKTLNRYKITVRNLSDEVLTDDVRVNVSPFLTIPEIPEGAKLKNNTLVWGSQHFYANQEREFYFNAYVAERPPKNLQVTARASIRTAVHSDSSSLVHGNPPNDIRVAITDFRTTVERGQKLTYTILVENRSDYVAYDVNINAGLSTYVQFADATEEGTWDGNNARWHLFEIPARGTRELRLTVHVREDAPFGEPVITSAKANGEKAVSDRTEVAARSTETGTPTASFFNRGDTLRRAYPEVTPRSYDPNAYTASHSYNTGTTVRRASTGEPSILFRKVADRTETVPGGHVRYTLYVRNTRSHRITNAVINDKFDSRVLQVVDKGDGTVVSPGHMQWNLPALEPGDVWETSYVLQVLPGTQHATSFSNIGSISGKGLEDTSAAERVFITSAAVIRELPQTGFGMDSAVAGVFFLLAAGAVALQKRKMYQ